jgi:tetratricopeptide (TPR) repeat protein
MSLNGSRLRYWRLKLGAIGQLALMRRGAALEVFSAMLESWPDDAYALSSRSHLRAQLGQLDEALSDARRLTEAHPQRSAGDWFNLAYLLDACVRWTEAEAAFRKALSLDARLDQAWYGLGLVLIRLQRLDEALEALQRNTELQPMSPFCWYQRARVHAERHDTHEVRRIIRRLDGFEPKVAAQLERETGLAA